MENTQSTLFDPHHAELTTSALAKQQIEESGTAAADRAFAVDLVRAYPGYTANELEHEANCWPGRVWKRLAECEKRKRVRRGPKKTCKITRRKCFTWEPVD